MSATLIYIHGFNSSPDTPKAQATWEYLRAHGMAINFLAPQIPVYPREAMDMLSGMIEQAVKPVALIGSSLGGFFATALAAKYGLKAVLINPAVRPHQLMAEFMGDNTQPYTGEHYKLTVQHVKDLEDMDARNFKQPTDLMVMLQTGDSTLDYRLAVEKYKGCKLFIEGGGSHTFEGYERYLSDVFKHLFG